MATIRRQIKGTLTPEQRRRHAEIIRQVERDRPRLNAQGLARRAELDALADAMKSLKQARQAKGISLSEVARRSGIDKSRLSKLENDPHPNPTLHTLTRIAQALGVRLSVAVS